ncbi:hypothetical protein [Chryseobacterium aquaticum]|uniref:DUF4747 domain-containing protein n=1 Tax=Chryseobacterium aquaticum subsp. greenlandense TaxID=345663 RepID=A0A101CHK2_9FLAO|nr:hypothetical protein [Chryseobacterium aquaticum]KUJ56343.1 hypothetical protein AR686_07205 [Chryseobacterium aquaticum subsp. greenlandense]
MKSKDVKIQFATLFKIKYLSQNDSTEVPLEVQTQFDEVDDVVRYILTLSKKKRFYNLKSDKFCFLDDAKIEDNIISGCFKSARNEFRPNIINKQTGEERKNPKTKLDGEIEKTHFVIKIDEDEKEVFIFLESNYFGVTILNIANYFNTFSKKFAAKNHLPTLYSLKYSLVGINNFKTELERIYRTKVAEIYYDKQILGNGFLNLTQRLIPVKEDVIVTIKADKGMDIQKVAISAYNLLSNENKNNGISRVRIKGQDENGNETIIDTEIMARKEFVTSKIDEETGEFDTTELVKQIVIIAQNF